VKTEPRARCENRKCIHRAVETASPTSEQQRRKKKRTDEKKKAKKSIGTEQKKKKKRRIDRRRESHVDERMRKRTSICASEQESEKETQRERERGIENDYFYATTSDIMKTRYNS